MIDSRSSAQRLLLGALILFIVGVANPLLASPVERWRITFLSGDVVNARSIKFTGQGFHFAADIAVVPSTTVKLSKIASFSRLGSLSGEASPGLEKSSEPIFRFWLRDGSSIVGQLIKADLKQVQLQSSLLGALFISRSSVYEITRTSPGTTKIQADSVVQSGDFVTDYDRLTTVNSDRLFGQLSAKSADNRPASSVMLRSEHLSANVNVAAIDQVTFQSENLNVQKLVPGAKFALELHDGSSIYAALESNSNASNFTSALLKTEKKQNLVVKLSQIKSVRHLPQLEKLNKQTVLVWTAFCDQSNELERIESLLARLQPRHFIHKSRSLAADTDFKNKLKLAGTLIIPEPKKNVVAADGLPSVLQQHIYPFLLRGGRLIVLNPGDEFLELASSAGLLHATRSRVVSGQNCRFTKGARAFALDIGPEFRVANETMSYRSSKSKNSALTPLVKSDSGFVAASWLVGRGEAILFGADYFRSDYEQDQFFLNLIKIRN